MKKILLSVLSIFSIITLMSCTLLQNKYLYEIVEDYAIITGYEGNASNLTIPSEIKDNKILYPVKEIGEEAFYQNETIKKVVIPKGVIKIGKMAFEYCINLKDVKMPSTLINIELAAFGGCIKLKKVEIPESVEYIGGYSFARTGLKEINVPGSVKVIGIKTFEQNSELKKVTINIGTTEIYEQLFYKCPKLEVVEIPYTIKEFSSYIFEKCDNLEKIYYNGTLQDFCNVDMKRSFQSRCEAKLYLKNNDGEYYEFNDLIIDNTLENIGAFQFVSTTSLKTVTIEEGVTIINGYQFADCLNLKEVKLPSSLKEIQSYAFFSCVSLEYVVIPDSVETIGIEAFSKNNAIIYCEATSKPLGWSKSWCREYREAEGIYTPTVYWGNEWEYVNGVPTVINK